MSTKRDERGASSVVVALLMTALLAAAGLGIDTSSASYERSRVQQSADSSALAIARDCALAKVTCSNAGASGTATYFANQSSAGGTVSIPGTVAAGTGSVEVRISKNAAMNFGSALGIAPKTVTGTAKATWSTAAKEGTPILPLAISWCDYWDHRPDGPGGSSLYQTNLDIFSRGSSTCPGPPGIATVTGRKGAIWFTESAFSCEFRTTIGLLTRLLTILIGTPAGCASRIGSLLPGQTYLLPIYREVNWTPGHSSLPLEIVGFAPLKVEGWRFTWLLIFKDRQAAPANNCSDSFLSSCNGLTGTFVRTAVKDPAFDYGVAPNLGAVDVKLTN